MLNLLTYFRFLNPFNGSKPIFLNDDGTILTWTVANANQSKISSEQAIGKFYSFLFKAAGHEQAFYEDLLVTAAQKGHVSRKITLNSEGKPIQANVILESIKDENGTVIGYTIVPPRPSK